MNRAILLCFETVVVYVDESAGLYCTGFVLDVMTIALDLHYYCSPFERLRVEGTSLDIIDRLQITSGGYRTKHGQAIRTVRIHLTTGP